MRKLRSASVVVFTLVVAGSAFGATFIIPTDRELVRAAKAIVIATAQSSYAERADERMINTVYVFRVEEVIRGEVPLEDLRVAEPGGFLDKEGIAVPGAPSYAAGERVLIFLDVNKQGHFRTWGMGIGKFNFVRDAHGKRLLMRGQGDEAVFGWTAAGAPHEEVVRAEEKFLQFVRDEARGGAGDTDYEVEEAVVTKRPKLRTNVNGSGFDACDYATSVGGFGGACGGKWKDIFDQPGGSGSVNFTLIGSQSGGVNGPTGVAAAMAAWNNDSLSNVNLGTAGGSSEIRFDDTQSVTDNCGASAIGCAQTAFTDQSFTFDGGTFIPLTQVIVWFDAGFTANQSFFNQVAAHEIGHGLGFRHSDQPGATPNTGGTSCMGTPPAIMVSCANTGFPIGATLQAYDIDAVQTMYNPNPVLAAPTGVTATATDATIVQVVWTASAGAASYNVYRSIDGTNYSPAGSTTAPTVIFNDTGRSANTAYLYKVRAVNGGESGDSNRDLATTVIFTDDPLVQFSTLIKATHITQLRTAVDAVRTLAGIGAGSYTTDPTITAGSTTAKAGHITQLRTALDAGRSTLTLSALSYGETPTAGVTTVKASHVTELRNGVK